MLSVFAVLVQSGDEWVRTGTATLIDSSGIFVTAAHVVHDDKANPIVLEQKIAQYLVRFEVAPISRTDNFLVYDFVLLRATGDDWRKDAARFPYPVRLGYI
jgi:hypothetical protein